MSMLEHHLFTKPRIAPTLARAPQFLGFNVSTPITMTLSVTPVEGNFMLLLFGSNQNRDFSLAGGWSRIDYAGATMIAWYKFAGASESTSLSIPWTVGGLAQGSLFYLEFQRASRVNTLAYSGGVVSQTGGTNHDYGPHNIGGGVFAIEFNHNGDNTVTASTTDGYTLLGSGAGTRTRLIYKSYGAAENNVNPTWIYSASEDSNIAIIGVNGL